MRSTTRLALTCASILASTAPLLSGCVSAPPIVAVPSACSSLIPSSHRKPVPGADLPSTDADAGDVWAFADAQTGQLDKANGHTADAIEIVSTCEARDAKTVAKLQRPPWKFW